MRSPACLAVLGVLAACGGKPLATTLTASSPSPVPDVFQCARDQIKALDFDQNSIDVREYRLTARRIDDTQRRADVQFRRVIDRLEIKAEPGSGNTVTALEVTPRTFAEYTTQRGPTEVQERTSTTAQEAAQKLIERCGGEVAPSAS
jgi:hypothetical protein